ncbi:basic-leucine zipper transcription factor A-like [Macrobrachium rosenbergii]|uniref:basic-leucine zipper transcription factor A-like n=1 Tax=Macrobrachium rosenbergii TaxID=79674 RepID=UPI0034D610B6
MPLNDPIDFQHSMAQKNEIQTSVGEGEFTNLYSGGTAGDHLLVALGNEDSPNNINATGSKGGRSLAQNGGLYLQKFRETGAAYYYCPLPQSNYAVGESNVLGRLGNTPDVCPTDSSLLSTQSKKKQGPESDEMTTQLIPEGQSGGGSNSSKPVLLTAASSSASNNNDASHESSSTGSSSQANHHQQGHHKKTPSLTEKHPQPQHQHQQDHLRQQAPPQQHQMPPQHQMQQLQQMQHQQQLQQQQHQQQLQQAQQQKQQQQQSQRSQQHDWTPYDQIRAAGQDVSQLYHQQQQQATGDPSAAHRRLLQQIDGPDLYKFNEDVATPLGYATVAPRRPRPLPNRFSTLQRPRPTISNNPAAQQQQQQQHPPDCNHLGPNCPHNRQMQGLNQGFSESPHRGGHHHPPRHQLVRSFSENYALVSHAGGLQGLDLGALIPGYNEPVLTEVQALVVPGDNLTATTSSSSSTSTSSSAVPNVPRTLANEGTVMAIRRPQPPHSFHKVVGGQMAANASPRDIFEGSTFN